MENFYLLRAGDAFTAFTSSFKFKKDKSFQMERFLQRKLLWLLPITSIFMYRNCYGKKISSQTGTHYCPNVMVDLMFTIYKLN